MEHLSVRWIRVLAPFTLCLLAPSVAYAQRIPDEAIWCAGASLFAPFVAIPLKMIALRLLALDVPTARLWSLAALEWLLWFPVAVILLRARGLYSVPIAIAALLAAAMWLHKTRVAGVTWRSAALLSLSTPLLAIALPFLAFAAAVFVNSLGWSWSAA